MKRRQALLGLPVSKRMLLVLLILGLSLTRSSREDNNNIASKSNLEERAHRLLQAPGEDPSKQVYCIDEKIDYDSLVITEDERNEKRKGISGYQSEAVDYAIALINGGAFQSSFKHTTAKIYKKLPEAMASFILFFILLLFVLVACCFGCYGTMVEILDSAMNKKTAKGPNKYVVAQTQIEVKNSPSAQGKTIADLKRQFDAEDQKINENRQIEDVEELRKLKLQGGSQLTEKRSKEIALKREKEDKEREEFRKKAFSNAALTPEESRQKSRSIETRNVKIGLRLFTICIALLVSAILVLTIIFIIYLGSAYANVKQIRCSIAQAIAISSRGEGGNGFIGAQGLTYMKIQFVNYFKSAEPSVAVNTAANGMNSNDLSAKSASTSSTFSQLPCQADKVSYIGADGQTKIVSPSLKSFAIDTCPGRLKNEAMMFARIGQNLAYAKEVFGSVANEPTRSNDINTSATSSISSFNLYIVTNFNTYLSTMSGRRAKFVTNEMLSVIIVLAICIFFIFFGLIYLIYLILRTFDPFKKREEVKHEAPKVANHKPKESINQPLFNAPQETFQPNTVPSRQPAPPRDNRMYQSVNVPTKQTNGVSANLPESRRNLKEQEVDDREADQSKAFSGYKGQGSKISEDIRAAQPSFHTVTIANQQPTFEPIRGNQGLTDVNANRFKIQGDDEDPWFKSCSKIAEISVNADKLSKLDDAENNFGFDFEVLSDGSIIEYKKGEKRNRASKKDDNSRFEGYPKDSVYDKNSVIGDDAMSRKVGGSAYYPKSEKPGVSVFSIGPADQNKVSASARMQNQIKVEKFTTEHDRLNSQPAEDLEEAKRFDNKLETETIDYKKQMLGPKPIAWILCLCAYIILTLALLGFVHSFCSYTLSIVGAGICRLADGAITTNDYFKTVINQKNFASKFSDVEVSIVDNCIAPKATGEFPTLLTPSGSFQQALGAINGIIEYQANKGLFTGSTALTNPVVGKEMNELLGKYYKGTLKDSDGNSNEIETIKNKFNNYFCAKDTIQYDASSCPSGSTVSQTTDTYDYKLNALEGYCIKAGSVSDSLYTSRYDSVTSGVCKSASNFDGQSTLITASRMMKAYISNYATVMTAYTQFYTEESALLTRLKDSTTSTAVTSLADDASIKGLINSMKIYGGSATSCSYLKKAYIAVENATCFRFYKNFYIQTVLAFVLSIVLAVMGFCVLILRSFTEKAEELATGNYSSANNDGFKPANIAPSQQNKQTNGFT